MPASTQTFAAVTDVLVTVLAIDGRRAAMTRDTPLFGSLPELDSLAVVELTVALEERFGLEIDDADFGGEIFETLGSLADFVEHQSTVAHRP